MRILADTNILISALWFPKSRVARTLNYIVANHNLVLCEHNLRELKRVALRDSRATLEGMEAFISELSFELIPSSDAMQKPIRDPKDQPILNAAIAGAVDIILTGDKDFLAIDMYRPRPMSVSQFIDEEELEI